MPAQHTMVHVSLRPEHRVSVGSWSEGTNVCVVRDEKEWKAGLSWPSPSGFWELTVLEYILGLRTRFILTCRVGKWGIWPLSPELGPQLSQPCPRGREELVGQCSEWHLRSQWGRQHFLTQHSSVFVFLKLLLSFMELWLVIRCLDWTSFSFISFKLFQC